MTDIRPCVACNTCVDRAESGGPIGLHAVREGSDAADRLAAALNPV